MRCSGWSPMLPGTSPGSRCRCDAGYVNKPIAAPNPAAQTAFGPMVLAAVEHHEAAGRRLVDDDLAESFLPTRLRVLVRLTRLGPAAGRDYRGLERRRPGAVGQHRLPQAAHRRQGVRSGQRGRHRGDPRVGAGHQAIPDRTVQLICRCTSSIRPSTSNARPRRCSGPSAAYPHRCIWRRGLRT